MFKRIFLIILDSCGVSHAIDSDNYGDYGANTFGHVVSASKVKLPNMRKLGFHNLAFDGNDKTISLYMRAKKKGLGNDSLTGHLELMGVDESIPSNSFEEDGFPYPLLANLSQRIGRGILGNKVSLDEDIINEFGNEHIRTGKIIVYTLGDYTLNIAAHESIVPLEELYEICKIAMEITSKDEWRVGRIVACPFTGEPDNFKLTSNKRSFVREPRDKTCLDYLNDKKIDIHAIGKINDLFGDNIITKKIDANNNAEGIAKLLADMDDDYRGLCLINLDDFDYYGHHRDVDGYANKLLEFDEKIPEILKKLHDDDLLIITSDHGNDPIWDRNDHTRENVPVCVYTPKIKGNICGKTLDSLSDIGKTIADNFGVDCLMGKSFLDQIERTK